jgi:phosphoserine phosphatase RsbU/P
MFSDGIAEILPAPDMAAKEKLLLELVCEGQGSLEYFVKKLGLENKKGLPDDVTMLTLWRALE